MTEIKITIEINGHNSTQTMELETETYEEIERICNERKCSISDLIVNDITEMTPEQAEEIIFNWDM